MAEPRAQRVRAEYCFLAAAGNGSDSNHCFPTLAASPCCICVPTFAGGLTTTACRPAGMRFRRTGPTSRSLADLYHCCRVSLGDCSGDSATVVVVVVVVVVVISGGVIVIVWRAWLVCEEER